MPQDTEVEHCVAISCTTGFRGLTNKNTHFNNCSIFQGGAFIAQSFANPGAGDGMPTMYMDNCFQSGGGQAYIFDQYEFDYYAHHCWAKSGGTFSPTTSTKYDSSTGVHDAGFGADLVQLPAGAPGQTAGLGGKWPSGARKDCIGAEILYQYVGGTLTATPLWIGGPLGVGDIFPRGAIITGLNDVAGASPFDVGLRIGHVFTSAPSSPLVVNSRMRVDSPKTSLRTAGKTLRRRMRRSP
jgi:hypothetical protein